MFSVSSVCLLSFFSSVPPTSLSPQATLHNPCSSCLLLLPDRASTVLSMVMIFSPSTGWHGEESRLHHLCAGRAGAGKNQKNMRRVREIALWTFWRRKNLKVKFNMPNIIWWLFWNICNVTWWKEKANNFVRVWRVGCCLPTLTAHLVQI